MSLGRVLVIDNDEQVRTVTRLLLVSAGYDVQEAASGKAALACVCQQRADVIITDVSIPDMDAVALIRELRLADPQVKIIAMSGGGIEPHEYQEIALQLGARLVIPKPFTKDLLIAVVNDVLAT